MPTHSWLHSESSPTPWPGPPPSAPPPPPTLSAPPPTDVPATSSGYDAPAPDTRWHTYLQRGPLPDASPARPGIPLAAVLVIAGAALVGLGSVLTWATFPAEVEAFGLPRSFNGFTELAGESKDGPFFAVFAAILAAFGITSLLARRLLPILIIGMIIAGFGLVAALIDFLDVANPDASVRAALEPSAGPGLPVVIGGFAIALGGLIAGTVTRQSRSG